MRAQPPGCRDEVRTKTIGSAKLGFPVSVTTTIYQPDGKTTTSVQEALELSRDPLSAALFDVPEGYTLAKNMQELYGMGAGATSAGASYSEPTRSSTTSTAETSLLQQQTQRHPTLVQSNPAGYASDWFFPKSG